MSHGPEWAFHTSVRLVRSIPSLLVIRPPSPLVHQILIIVTVLRSVVVVVGLHVVFVYFLLLLLILPRSIAQTIRSFCASLLRALLSSLFLYVPRLRLLVAEESGGSVVERKVGRLLLDPDAGLRGGGGRLALATLGLRPLRVPLRTPLLQELRGEKAGVDERKVFEEVFVARATTRRKRARRARFLRLADYTLRGDDIAVWGVGEAAMKLPPILQRSELVREAALASLEFLALLPNPGWELLLHLRNWLVVPGAPAATSVFTEKKDA